LGFVKGRLGATGVLILGVQHLVVLEVPKTGSLALLAMLRPYTLPASDMAARHIGYDGYQRNHAPALSQAFGQMPQTVAVLRDPMERMQSWYRYRRRPQLNGLPASTAGVSFEDFVLAYLDGTNPAMASIGRQDRFVGWNGRMARVDHLFDYGQLPLMEAFFSARIGAALTLPKKNKSARGAQIDYSLTKRVITRFQIENLEEITLYHKVASTGHLMRPGV